MTGLRIGRDRVRLYGIGLALIGLTQMRFVASVGQYWDWVGFYSAGALAGTRTLLDSAAYTAWGTAHGLSVMGFPYLPGFAWVLAPAATLSIPWGFALNVVLMSAAALFAARLAARTYSLDKSLATYMTIGWAPITAAIVTGQNSPLGLLLSLVAIDGLAREADERAGIAVGALCYKPTYALPFVLLLLIYRKWKAVGVVAACGVIWYAASAMAAGGNWLWPAAYLKMIAALVGPDYASNRFKSVSLPGVLILAGASPATAIAIGGVGLVAALAWLKARRVELFAAASLAGLIGVATSGHSWAYDAAMALPALWWAVGNVAEPWRTRGVVVAYAIAPLWMAAHTVRFDLLAIVVVGGMGWVLVTAGRGETAKVTRGEANEGRS